MAYAKACKYGCGTQIIWDNAASKFKENATGEFHTRERCEEAKDRGIGKYSPQREKEFVDSYVSQQQQPKQDSRNWNSEKLDVIEAQYQRLIPTVDNIAIAINKVMSMIQQQQENNPTVRDNMVLRQRVTELEEVIKKQENNFVPANQVPTDEQKEAFMEGPRTQDAYDQHVREMVKKGEEQEELEI